MTQAELQKLVDAQIITDEQRTRITEFFGVDKTRNIFLTIILGIGGVLALAGIILLISANWDAIPRQLKIAAAAALMAIAHVAGWHLRGSRQTQPKLGEAFHFLGAGMFMANIALIGQAYNLSSRTPNAVLFWLVSIIPLGWLLRAASIHALSLVGLVFWIGTEINAGDGWFQFAKDESQMVIYAALGLFLYGTAGLISKTRFPRFSDINERFGLLLFHLTLWPMLVMGSWHDIANNGLVFGVAGALTVPALLVLYYRSRRVADVSRWQLMWPAVLIVWITCVATWHLCHNSPLRWYNERTFDIFQLIAAVAMIVGCIVQIRTAVERREMWMVNLALVSIGYTIIAEFALLFGSMMNTGLIFLVGGAGLLGLGYLLERNRRSALRQIRA